MLTYVRWQKGLSRRGRVFPGLAPDHVATTMTCLYCGVRLDRFPEFDGAPPVQLIAVGLIDPDADEIAKFERGGWVSAGAVVIHQRCADQMDDEQLEDFIGELHVQPAEG